MVLLMISYVLDNIDIFTYKGDIWSSRVENLSVSMDRVE